MKSLAKRIVKENGIHYYFTAAFLTRFACLDVRWRIQDWEQGESHRRSGLNDQKRIISDSTDAIRRWINCWRSKTVFYSFYSLWEKVKFDVWCNIDDIEVFVRSYIHVNNHVSRYFSRLLQTVQFYVFFQIVNFFFKYSFLWWKANIFHDCFGIFCILKNKMAQQLAQNKKFAFLVDEHVNSSRQQMRPNHDLMETSFSQSNARSKSIIQVRLVCSWFHVFKMYRSHIHSIHRSFLWKIQVRQR